MKKQMVAERARRGDFIRSEGKKAAVRLLAEGEKMVSISIHENKIGDSIANTIVKLVRARITRVPQAVFAIESLIESQLFDSSSITLYDMGIAEQEATRKRSEGDSSATVELARAESVSLETIAATIKADGGSQADYMIADKFLELFRFAGNQADNKTIYFPYKVNGLTGIVRRLPSVYGSSAVPPTIERRLVSQGTRGSTTQRSVKDDAVHEYDELN
jgi:regulator of protease activity HflC (stomatin/prohibitin superfamily)